MSDFRVTQQPRGRRAILRSLGATGLALLLFGFAIARLRRVPRPTFVAVESIANTRATLGAVKLIRRGESNGTLLGWAVLCDGRELVSVLGEARPTIERHDATVTVRRGDLRRSFDGRLCR